MRPVFKWIAFEGSRYRFRESSDTSVTAIIQVTRPKVTGRSGLETNIRLGCKSRHTNAFGFLVAIIRPERFRPVDLICSGYADFVEERGENCPSLRYGMSLQVGSYC